MSLTILIIGSRLMQCLERFETLCTLWIVIHGRCRRWLLGALQHRKGWEKFRKIREAGKEP